jgi:hypothetical protein
MLKVKISGAVPPYTFMACTGLEDTSLAFDMTNVHAVQ